MERTALKRRQHCSKKSDEKRATVLGATENFDKTSKEKVSLPNIGKKNVIFYFVILTETNSFCFNLFF